MKAGANLDMASIELPSGEATTVPRHRGQVNIPVPDDSFQVMGPKLQLLQPQHPRIESRNRAQLSNNAISGSFGP